MFEPSGDLSEVVINGGRGDQDVPGDEFNAITGDYLRAKYGDKHPAIRG